MGAPICIGWDKRMKNKSSWHSFRNKKKLTFVGLISKGKKFRTYEVRLGDAPDAPSFALREVGPAGSSVPKVKNEVS